MRILTNLPADNTELSTVAVRVNAVACVAITGVFFSDSLKEFIR